jgi:hypothetical protein
LGRANVLPARGVLLGKDRQALEARVSTQYMDSKVHGHQTIFAL